MRIISWILLGLVALLAGCAHVGRGDALAQIMQTDRDFSRRAQEIGLRTAFVEYAAPDAVMFRAGVGPLRGHAAIAEAFVGAESIKLEWVPEAAEVAASGDLATTWGWYTLTAKDGKSSTGNYVSVWRRIDGHWRWVIDLGVPAPRPR